MRFLLDESQPSEKIVKFGLSELESGDWNHKSSFVPSFKWISFSILCLFVEGLSIFGTLFIHLNFKNI